MPHTIVTREDWTAARKALLAKEKALTRQRDALAAERRALPWVRIDKPYKFATPFGQVGLAELFAGRSQLVIKHFMLAPGQLEGCVGCSFEMDHLEGALTHLNAHDVSVVAVARAPLAEIEAFKARMGWRTPWVSSFGSDFNYDFNVSFTPAQMAEGTAEYNYACGPMPIADLSGFSIFYKDAAGDIFHTYGSFGRGGEEVLSAYMVLDMTPKGRNEQGPRFNLTDWVRHHDRYGAAGHVDDTGRWRPATSATEPACPACQ
jgi:predicted dithiol-disulfide oxidoreductase (DUF899 family)